MTPRVTRAVKPRREFLSLARRALATGARLEGSTLHYNVAVGGRYPCIAPVSVATFKGSADRSVMPFGRVAEDAIGFVEVWSRCRRCQNCLKQRRAEWVARALREQAACQGRVWFVTLTGNPQFRDYVNTVARASTRPLIPYGEPIPHEALVRVWKREVSLFLKRLRKGVGARRMVRFRFMAVLERHEDGAPHCHLLLYEKDSGFVTWRLIERRWGSRGFINAQLVDGKAAAYVAKYLGKQVGAQVWASLRFGSPR